MKNIILRNETQTDNLIVENLTREAFWNQYVPGCVEHYLLHVMRNSDPFINELDIVAEVDGKIVGNIVYTKAKIIGDNDESYEVITFGPVSVLPELQGKGIGGKLIEHTKKLAKEMGYRGILIYGDPDFYSKFGFVQAEEYGIGTSDNMYAVSLQVFELHQGALSECKGCFHEGSIFEIDPEAAEEYDKNFPYKEKKSGLPTQDRFQQLVGMRKLR
ncbi:MAG: GNAT family N-acetyltransferase [Flexilinea sp.]